MVSFTIFGAEGWIGSALALELASKGHQVRRVTRKTWPPPGQKLDNVVFAVGLTADFRGYPMQTAQAHVAALLDALERYRYDSFLYLSSTRVYRGAKETIENAALVVNPSDPDDVYNITKLAGESVCLSLADPHVRVARLSNVIGVGDHSGNFLSSVVSEAQATGRLIIMTSRESEKDYIGLSDILSLIESIALRGKYRLYNLASGRNVSHGEIAEMIIQTLRADVSFAENAAVITYPRIAIDRIRGEFGFTPSTFEKLFLEIVGIKS
jgi:nucleoside-diphosphate-sugar epimerase